MKKLLSFAISTVFIALSFTSCSTPAKNYSPMITVSSSDAEGDARWLTNRLGVLKDKVYLGIGNGEFDMTDFEDDGYIIRSNDGEAVVIGKTSAGLTNGVRKYANYVDRKMSDKLDVSYHEGYRIDKLTLAGVDISEYAIEYENPNANMTYAAGEFARMLEKACGVKLGISEKITDRKHAIEFRHTSDPEFKENGYRYFFEGERLVIEGAVERGCMYGMGRFLKNELNWMGLGYYNYWSEVTANDTFLYESDHIDVPADTSAKEVPSFNFFITSPGYANKKTEAKYPTLEERSYGPAIRVNHGQQGFKWGGYGATDSQICYNDEEVYENIYIDIRDHVENLYTTGYDGYIRDGYLQGTRMVDIAHGDNINFCKCNNCMMDLKKTGTYAHAMVRFANRLSDDLAAEFPNEPPVLIGMFAYMGNMQPPKDLKLNDNILVTYCADHCCLKHKLEDDCTELPWYVHESDYYWDGYINQDIEEWMRGWAEITNHMYVWYYIIEQGPMQYVTLDNYYYDLKLMESLGVEGIYIECENHGMGAQYLCAELGEELNWNQSLTKADYDSYLCRILEKEYGDGWEYISEYLDIWQTAQDKSDRCWGCWEWQVVQTRIYDLNYVAEMFEYCVELLERARDMACDEREIRNVELLSVHMYYNGCISTYYSALNRGDTEYLDLLSERYDLLVKRIRDNGRTTENLGYGPVGIQDTLEKAVEIDWAPYRDSLPQ